MNIEQYNHLMPVSNCELIKKTYGKGEEGHKQVVEWIKKFHHQTKKLAPIFHSDSFVRTCSSIKDFLYENIDYNEDDIYNIKSPACIWSSGKAECKNTTIFASSILINLGIKHYLRSVYYSGLSRHIYVVVPYDQKTGSLDEKNYSQKGYFPIDGTFKYHFEPIFSVKFCDTYIDPSDLDNTALYCFVKKKNYTKIAIGSVIALCMASVLKTT